MQVKPELFDHEIASKVKSIGFVENGKRKGSTFSGISSSNEEDEMRSCERFGEVMV